MLTLYHYSKSSASFRVRIALALKGIDHKLVAVNLREQEQNSEDYGFINQQHLVPTLKTNSGEFISQSMVILQWLESSYPDCSLSFTNNREQTRMWQIMNIVACDIHPLDNLRVLNYLSQELQVTEEDKKAWYHHWINLNFPVLESMIEPSGYALGKVSLADALLIPQIFNAYRFKVNMEPYPKLKALYQYCQERQAFKDAWPE